MTVRLALVCTILSMTLSAQQPMLTYPRAKKVDQVDDFFGTKIADPYRWLEDADAPDTRAWIEAQNALTFAFLEKIPERAAIQKRLTALWNYERYGAPSREGAWYVFTQERRPPEPGRRLQDEVASTRPPEVLIDPNTLSPDGTVALGEMSFSEDGRHMAYSLAAVRLRLAGVARARRGDWQGPAGPDQVVEVQRRGVAEGRLRLLLRAATTRRRTVPPCRPSTRTRRCTSTRSAPPGPGRAGLRASRQAGLGLRRRRDRRRPVPASSTRPRGRRTRTACSSATWPNPKGAIEPFLDDFDAAYTVVGNDGELFYVLTDKGAPRYRLVAIEPHGPTAAAWKTLIPEAPGRDVLESVTMVNDQFVTVWMTDAHNALRVHGLDGRRAQGRGAADASAPSAALSGRRRHSEAFYAFTSSRTRRRSSGTTSATGASTVFKKPTVDFDAAPVRDRAGLLPVEGRHEDPDVHRPHRKGLVRDGQNPTLLYGYGGFNISLTPAFSAGHRGVARDGRRLTRSANLRGGGEYGKEWHDAGRLKNKQNVFDDFIAAAECLIREQYTSASKARDRGRQQRRPAGRRVHDPAAGPVRRGAARRGRDGHAPLPQVHDRLGVDVRLRRPGHEGRVRHAIKYSPLHNIKPGVRYPATLVTTADHDDRVVPAHSFKFAAALQAAQAGAGAGADPHRDQGRPRRRQADHQADRGARRTSSRSSPAS